MASDKIIDLAVKAEDWRAQVCSCDNCDSFQCFALRYHSSPGCSCNKCERSNTCIFFKNIKENLNAQFSNPEIIKPAEVQKQPESKKVENSGKLEETENTVNKISKEDPLIPTREEENKNTSESDIPKNENTRLATPFTFISDLVQNITYAVKNNTDKNVTNVKDIKADEPIDSVRSNVDHNKKLCKSNEKENKGDGNKFIDTKSVTNKKDPLFNRITIKTTKSKTKHDNASGTSGDGKIEETIEKELVYEFYKNRHIRKKIAKEQTIIRRVPFCGKKISEAEISKYKHLNEGKCKDIIKKLDSYVIPKVTKEATSEILKKVKEIYRACSCKVCECIVSKAPPLKNNACNCKPCECNECCKWNNKEQLPKDKINNNALPLNNNESESNKINNVTLSKQLNTNDCKCDKPCMCIKCLFSKNNEGRSCGIVNQRNYIVARAGEGVPRISCQCSPCGCFDCAHPYGSITRAPVRHDMATEVRRHLNCNCEMCNNDHCEQEGADTCNCGRHSKLMRKPVQRDQNDYDIHHFTIETDEKSNNDLDNQENDNYDSVPLPVVKSSINKNINDSRYCQLVCKNTRQNAVNSSYYIKTSMKLPKMANSLKDCNCKPCECMKCRKHFLEGHIPSKRKKDCLCEICDCIHFSTLKNKQTDSKKVCNCKPCDCSECWKYNSLGLATKQLTDKYINRQNQEQTSLESECSFIKNNNQSGYVLPLLKATDSLHFVNKGTKQQSGMNNMQPVSKTQNLKSNSEDLQLYCAITCGTKYFNNLSEIDRSINLAHEKKYNMKGTQKRPDIAETRNGTEESNENKKIVKTSTSCALLSGISHDAFNTRTSPMNKRESIKSRNSSCNSSGHDNSDYLIRFPRSTVETCINDVLNLNVYKKTDFRSCLKPRTKSNFNNEYSVSTNLLDNCYNSFIFKGRHSYENDSILKVVDTGRISQIKMCQNWNSNKACDCQACDCFSCSYYKKRKFDKCRCDCAKCNCCGTCTSGDQLFLIKNEISQTGDSMYDSGEDSWNSNNCGGSETKALVQHLYPPWNSQELESKVSKDRETQLVRKSNVTFDETAYNKMMSTSPSRKSYQTINSCFDSSLHVSSLDMQMKYGSVEKTLQEAKAFSLELLEILRKYEEANKEFESMSEKYKILHESLLNRNYTKDSNKLPAIVNKQNILQENVVNTDLINIKESELTEFDCPEVVLPMSDMSEGINNSNMIACGISKLQTENTLVDIPVASVTYSTLDSERSNRKKVNNDSKIKLKDLKNQYEIYSKLINRAMIRCRREVWQKSSISTLNSNKDSKFTSITDDTDKSVGISKEPSEKQGSQGVNTVFLSSADKKVIDSVETHEKDTKYSMKKYTSNLLCENKYKINEYATYYKDGLVKVDSTENGEIYVLNKRKESFGNKLPTSKGFLTISDLEEASTSQDKYSKAKFKRKFESMPNMETKKASLCSTATVDDRKFMSIRSSTNPSKISFQAVRKVSDHTVIVKWKLPSVLADVLGYELLVDGRKVQSILNPTLNMAVVTCLPHSDKVSLTVRTITSKTTCGSYPSTTLVYRPRVKYMQ